MVLHVFFHAMISKECDMQKKMGLMECTALVTGNLVGSGVFMLPAILASYGSSSIISWAITACGATLLALVFSELSKQVTDEVGGPHAFILQAFGKEAGFWAAWGYWVLTWSSNTALLVTAASYLVQITGPLSPLSMLCVQLSIWATVSLVNLSGVENAAKFEACITVLKILPIIVIPMVALAYIDIEHFYSFTPLDTKVSLLEGMQASVFATMWAFIGVESATVPAKEVENPEKTIGQATILGTLLAAVVYIVGSIATIGVLGSSTLTASSAPYAQLASSIFGGTWASIIALCAIISCVGALNGWTLVVARIAQGAADQGLFPALFAKTNAQGTPVNSVLVASLCTLVSIVFTLQDDMLSQFNHIVDIAVTLILFIYFGCVLAYFKLTRGMNRSAYAIGIGAGLFVLFGLYASGVKQVMQAIALLLTGVVFRLRWQVTDDEDKLVTHSS